MEYKRYVQRQSLYLDFPKSKYEEDFMIVFDVSSLEEEELVIEFPEENKLKISFNHGLRDSGNFSFSRDCTYVYSLPENIQLTNLVAYWSGDDFLVIKEDKTGAAGNSSKFENYPDVEESKLSETPISPVSANYDEEKIKIEIISSNISKEGEENVMNEQKSTSSTIGQEEVANLEVKSTKTPSGNVEKTMLKESTSVSSESEKCVLQKEIPTNVSNENAKKIVQEKEAIDVSNESGEKIIQEEKSLPASSECEGIVQEKKSMHGSEVNTEDSVQKVKSVDASDSVQAKSRLYPKRVPNLLNRPLCVDDLQDVMNDIEKRMKFVNDFMDMHR